MQQLHYKTIEKAMKKRFIGKMNRCLSSCFGIFAVSAVGVISMYPPDVSATVLAQDSFDYTSGSALSGLNGGSGFASGWTNSTNTPGVITSTTYDYQVEDGGLIEGGNTGLRITANGAPVGGSIQTSTAIQRTLSQTYTGDSVFFSFVFRQTGGVVSHIDRMAFWAGSSGGPYGGVLQVGTTSGFFLRTNSSASSTASSAPAFALDTTYLFVLEFSKSTPGAGNVYDQARFWVNPAQGDQGTPLLFTSNANGNPISQFNSIGMEFINRAETSKDYYFDNFVMGTTWNDVVPIPEPSSGIMLVVGLGFLMRATGSRYNSRKNVA